MMSFKFFKGKEDMFSELGPMQTLSLRRDIKKINERNKRRIKSIV
jgi:hypothetical protein